jgi:hypothetical protein
VFGVVLDVAVVILALLVVRTSRIYGLRLGPIATSRFLPAIVR